LNKTRVSGALVTSTAAFDSSNLRRKYFFSKDVTTKTQTYVESQVRDSRGVFGTREMF
jgi:hypothetical protein